MSVVGTPWGELSRRLIGLASAIEGHLHNAGRPRPHEAAQLALGVGEMADRLATLSEALAATETGRMDTESTEAYRAAVGQLRASVAGLRRGAAELRR